MKPRENAPNFLKPENENWPWRGAGVDLPREYEIITSVDFQKAENEREAEHKDDHGQNADGQNSTTPKNDWIKQYIFKRQFNNTN